VIPAGSCEHSTTTNGRWILAATILGSSMGFIDGTIVIVALPALQSALRADIADIQWVNPARFFLAASILIGGSLGDLYGRRKIFVAGRRAVRRNFVGCLAAGAMGRSQGAAKLPPFGTEFGS